MWRGETERRLLPPPPHPPRPQRQSAATGARAFIYGGHRENRIFARERDESRTRPRILSLVLRLHETGVLVRLPPKKTLVADLRAEEREKIRP